MKEELDERLDSIIITGGKAVDAAAIADDILSWLAET